MSRLDRWLLPDGVEEFLPQQAESLEKIRRAVLDVFHRWGYELVVPPLIEYIESLLVGTGNDLDLQTFKLTDQISGRLMGIRADMTPQAARIDAHCLNREQPVRLCYMGEVLRTQACGFIRTRSPLQVGAELYGHGGIESDVEVLHLMVAALGAVGLREVHIDIGHVGIFRALARSAKLTEEQEQSLFAALQRKAKPEIEEQLAQYSIDKPVSLLLKALADLNGGEEVLIEARSMFKSATADVRAALDNLERIAAIARQRIPHVPLHFDLAELRGYRYQTGVVFAALVPGHGEEIARGGRYDDIGRAFGRARPATGFSTDLKTLIALSDTVTQIANAVMAPGITDQALFDAVQTLRDRGERVIYELPGQKGGAREMGCNRVLVQRGGEWVTENIK
ncbi:MAG: ATP phosphoribosyltransferase regulatory subunit [Gammaproteobacteria bacterium]|nr:MAG: ATP phosphoribosyltransferase regulatory subunit [Gammaproteobacteria bacterium]TND01742.1 MAG: ATP phosphoribosyltransferase regulatory subunit [Gammaproteobacteria bacterium]